jgi:hypothetical protein
MPLSLDALALRLAHLLLGAARRAQGEPPGPTAERRLRKLHRRAAALRREALARQLTRATGDRVASGPFRGMRLAPDPVWRAHRGGDCAPKLLGCYEQEVGEALEALRGQSFDSVINVGCAEGYYAVGCARIFAPARVLAVDVDPRALAATRAAADLNGVGSAVETQLGLDGPGLAAIAARHPRCLVVSDCEGFELELFDEQTVASLPQAHCIIECHDFRDRDTTATLAKRFADGHEVRVLEEGARDPSRYEALRELSTLDRWLAISEDRPGPMRWLACTPRT